MNTRLLRHTTKRRLTSDSRRGAFLLLAVFCLAALMGFTALCVDIGVVALEKTKLQNSVDAAAMAAVMEINAAIEQAGPDVENVTDYSMNAARQKAVDVAYLNGAYVDGSSNVEFGRRTYNADTESFEIEWGVTPANTVRVTAARTNENPEAPDAKVPVAFAGVLGSGPTSMVASAAAYVDARDIVAVIDFSGSMSHTSLFKPRTINDLGQPAIEANLEDIFNALQIQDIGHMAFLPTPLVVYSPPLGGPQ